MSTEISSSTLLKSVTVNERRTLVIEDQTDITKILTELSNDGLLVEFVNKDTGEQDQLRYQLKTNKGRAGIIISLPSNNEIQIGHLSCGVELSVKTAIKVDKTLNPQNAPMITTLNRGFMSTAHSLLAEYLVSLGITNINDFIPSKNMDSIFARIKTRSLQHPKQYFAVWAKKEGKDYHVITDLTKLMTEEEINQIIENLKKT